MRRSCITCILIGLAMLWLITGAPASARQRATAPLAKTGDVHIVLKVGAVPGQRGDLNAVKSAQQIITMRLHALGVSRVLMRASNKGSARFITVDLPGALKRRKINVADIKVMVQTTGRLTLVALGSTQLPRGASARGYHVLAGSTDVIGNQVRAGSNQYGAPVVLVSLRNPGASRVATYTSSHVGNYLGIAVDNRIYNSPVIMAAVLGGNFEITQLSSSDAANNLAIILRYSPLPVQLHVESVRMT